MPIPVPGPLLTATDLATHMHALGFDVEDEAAAVAAVGFATAQVFGVLGFDITGDTYDVDPFEFTIAKGVAVRIAAQWYTNPLDRATYSGPDGMGYTPSPQMLSKIMSQADRLDLVGIANKYAPGFA